MVYFFAFIEGGFVPLTRGSAMYPAGSSDPALPQTAVIGSCSALAMCFVLCSLNLTLGPAPGNTSPDFHGVDKGTRFVYDTVFANADFWSSVVQMCGLCCRP